MNRRQFLLASSILLAGALGACGLPGGTGDQQNQDAAQQFLTERNGGTPVAIGVGGPNAPVVGSIESVDGSKLTVKREMQGTMATVQLAAGAKIYKYVDAQLSEIKAGDSLIAFGEKHGDVLQVNLLRLGGDGSLFGGPVVFNSSSKQDNSGQMANGSGDKVIVGGPGDQSMMPALGTVKTIDGRHIVLKDTAGASTTVQLADGAKIEKQAEVAPAELTPGTSILAIGTQEGDIYQATQVQIVPEAK